MSLMAMRKRSHRERKDTWGADFTEARDVWVTVAGSAVTEDMRYEIDIAYAYGIRLIPCDPNNPVILVKNVSPY